jgi:hypothetical protein
MKPFLWASLLSLVLGTATLLWAFAPPSVLPLPNTRDIPIDATGVDIAVGTITQEVTFTNPTGALYDRQLLRIEVTSVLPQKVKWGDQFQPKHGIALPTTTTGKNSVDLWMFEYLGPLKVWSFVATTPPPPAPAAAAPTK